MCIWYQNYQSFSKKRRMSVSFLLQVLRGGERFSHAQENGKSTGCFFQYYLTIAGSAAVLKASMQSLFAFSAMNFLTKGRYHVHFLIIPKSVEICDYPYLCVFTSNAYNLR
jgi:hypothetical protein